MTINDFDCDIKAKWRTMKSRVRLNGLRRRLLKTCRMRSDAGPLEGVVLVPQPEANYCRDHGDSPAKGDPGNAWQKCTDTLLNNLDMAEKLRHAVLGNRKLEWAQDEARDENTKIWLESGELREATERYERGIVDLGFSHDAQPSETLLVMKAKMADLDKRQDKLTAREKLVEEKLQSMTNQHSRNVAELLDLISGVLIEKNIMSPDDFNNEYTYPILALEEEPTEHGVNEPEKQGPDTRDEDEVTPDAAVKEAERLIGNFESKRFRVYCMNQEFENREQRFEREAFERAQRLDAGGEVETAFSFDMRQLVCTRRMARELTEAEEAFAAAKAEAVRAGVQVPGSDVESGFVDCASDGYLSFEEDGNGIVNTDRIHAWLETAPSMHRGDSSGPEELLRENTDLDCWDARSVGMSESLSMRAHGSEKRHIMKWQAICALAKARLMIPETWSAGREKKGH